MRLTDFKNISINYAAILGSSLLLLSGCSGDDRQTNSSSSISSYSIASSSVSSFSSSSLSSSGISNSPYIGYWYAPAYGRVLSVNAESEFLSAKTYNVTENSCVRQDLVTGLSKEDVEQAYTYSNNSLLMSNGDYLPGIEYQKLEQLPDVCKNNLQLLKTDSGYTFNARNDFDIFWNTFNELYVNFDLRGLDWGKVYQEGIESVDSITNEQELFEHLSALIAPLGDRHAVLIQAPLTQNFEESVMAALAKDDTPIFWESRQLTLYKKLFNEYIQALELDRELTDAQLAAAENYIGESYDQITDIIFSHANESSDIKIRAAGEIAWFTTKDNLGYLFIGSMSDYGEGQSPLSSADSDIAIAEATINEALNDLKDTQGLIIDVRFNDGGRDQVALNFVRHFINQPQVVFSKFAGDGVKKTPIKEVVLHPQTDNIYVKPTAVLVSGDTVSAAEAFTLATASLPQVAIIGEPTAGAFSDILFKRLTSDIVFGISNETYLDVDGNNYEGIGIPPDITVPFATLLEREGNYDAGLDAAIEWIKTAP